MVKQSLALIFLAICSWLYAVPSQSAEPVASIDRGVITIEDTLTLTIRLSDTGRFSGPDTSPLERDFHVLGTSQSSRHSITNGRSESSTEWIINLAPKRIGTLQIPSIAVGNNTTGPLSVTVNPARTHSSTSDEPLFLESEVSAKQLYVQQQLLLTVRVFHSVRLDNMSLSDIEIENALVEKLDQTSFQRRINNRVYRVHELRYAIFPQKVGTLLIPEVIFSANEILSQRSVFSLPGQGRPIRRMTKQYEIDVQAPPPGLSLRPGNPWLPAKDLQILESWSSNPDDIRVGDSITRTITLKARGLLGSQLPPIQFEQVPGARLYPDQGQVENTLTEQGASAIRTDSTAIIPTREGRFEIPAVTIKWWDTEQQKLKTASLAARTLQVKPALSGSGNTEPRTTVDHSQDAVVTTATGSARSASPIWPVLTCLFAALWLVTLGLWWRAKQASPAPGSAGNADTAPDSERKLFKTLLTTIQSGDSQQTRDALIRWARAFWPQQAIHSLQQIAGVARQASLTKQLQLLDRSLYGDTTSTPQWDAENLVKTLKMIRSTQQHNAESHASLPPLYSNA